MNKKQMNDFYKLRQEGASYPFLAKKYKTSTGRLCYLYKLIEKHGLEFVNKKTKFSDEIKKEAVNRLKNGEKMIDVALDVGVKTPAMLYSWKYDYN